MKALGIDINEGVKGVDLPDHIHNYTKGDSYFAHLKEFMRGVDTPEAFRERLKETGNILASGRRIDDVRSLI